MKDSAIILLEVASVAINGLIDHFFPRVGILITPFVVASSACLIVVATKGINPVLKSIFPFACVSFNDIAIKLYGGGTHDMEGMGWLTLFFFAGLVPVYGILIAGSNIDRQSSWLSKITALAVFPMLVAVHLYLFSRLGLGRSF